MPNTYKNARLSAPAASTTTYATLYSTGASTTAVISTLTICNTGSVDALYRVGITDSAGSPSAASGEFLAYDATIQPGETAFVPTIALGNSQFIRCSASQTAVNFIAMISEIEAA